MNQLLFTAFIAIALIACNTKSNTPIAIDALPYAYKATYSSDITAPSHPEYAQKVLKVWKMFEGNKIDSMKQYYADTVTYENSNGQLFHGSINELLSYAAKDVGSLDSLRFDISMWQSVHLNDKNEDWVYIWATERRYDKTGKSDTSLIHEQWKIDHNKISYFNQYTAIPVKPH